MAITIERAEKLAAYLKADPQRGKELLEMPVEEALEKINADGNDFTVEELQEFDQAMVNASNEGELSEDDLDSVVGGITIATATLAFSIIKWGAPYAWKAGQWLGKKITGR